MTSTLRMLVDKTVPIIRAGVPSLIALYVYGSWASGEATQASDLDLAVLADVPLFPETLWGMRNALSESVAMDVDLVDLGRAATVFRAQVVSTGVCVLDVQPRRREMFEDVTYAAYARLNEERSAILKDIRERGSVYGG